MAAILRLYSVSQGHIAGSVELIEVTVTHFLGIHRLLGYGFPLDHGLKSNFFSVFGQSI